MPMGFGSYAGRSVATNIVATDGTGDFTDIQTAVDALPSGGGVVYIKQGTYTVSAKIEITTENIALIGAGKSTVLTTAGSNIMVDLLNASGCLIDSMYFYGNNAGANAGRGIYVDDSNKVIVRNCWFENLQSLGITFVATSADCLAFGNYVSDCGSVGTAGIAVSGSGHYIANNVVTACGLHGIQLGSSTTNIVIGNACTANVGHGISLGTSHNNVINGNICEGNDSADSETYDGISLLNSDYNVITGNRCKDNDRYEINISAVNCNSNLVVGNSAIGTDHVGTINDDGTTSIIANNAES